MSKIKKTNNLRKSKKQKKARQGKKAERAKFDECFKKIFSLPEVVQGLLEYLALELPILNGIDFSTATKLGNEYITTFSARRQNDLVWKLELNGQDFYLLFMLEIQVEPQKHMPVRMLEYIALLYNDIISQDPSVADNLPPILPVVLYLGEYKWQYPTDLSILYHDNIPASVLAFQAKLKFILVWLQDEAITYLGENNFFSLIAAIEQSKNPVMIQEAISVFMRAIRSTNNYEELKNACINYFNFVLYPRYFKMLAPSFLNLR